MNRLTRRSIDLDLVLDTIERRFEFDVDGRIVGARSEGVSPRFVLGRAREGCVWRFRSDLDVEIVRRVSRLAAREPGFPRDAGPPHPAPERWVMIERHFEIVEPASRGKAATVPERIERAGRVVGEIWCVE